MLAFERTIHLYALALRFGATTMPRWQIRARLAELPAARRARYAAAGLPPYDAAVIVADPAMTTAYEAIVAAGPDLPAKEVANLVTGDYARAAKESDARGPAGLVGRASAPELAGLLRRVLAGELSRANAREVFVEHVEHGRLPGTLLREPVGDGGFGYDPIVVLDEGDGRTFAEMTPAEKHAISHRSRAFTTLAALL